MFPTKNMLDYMTEMNRLFPKATENDNQTFHSNLNPSYLQSAFSNSPLANRSSSSADSTSPESFPDLSGVPYRPRYRPPTPDCHLINDTPFPARRQRPIMGRNIMNTDRPFEPRMPETPYKCTNKQEDFEMRSYWHRDLPQTPPSISPTTPTKSENFYGQRFNNQVYELFPSESKSYEFRTPVKMSFSQSSDIASHLSLSPNSAMSVSNSPITQHFTCPPQPFKKNYPLQPSRANSDAISGKFCSFCRKNGETPLVYMTHTVRERIGNMSIVSCPILRSHVCSTCQATGDNAHTITYCPVLRSNNNGLPLQSTTITLKNSRLKSNGRKRY